MNSIEKPEVAEIASLLRQNSPFIPKSSNENLDFSCSFEGGNIIYRMGERKVVKPYSILEDEGILYIFTPDHFGKLINYKVQVPLLDKEIVINYDAGRLNEPSFRVGSEKGYYVFVPETNTHPKK